MTLTDRLDLDSVKMMQCTKGHLFQKLLFGHRDRHTRPIALTGPLRWSVIITPYQTSGQKAVESYSI